MPTTNDNSTMPGSSVESQGVTEFQFDLPPFPTTATQLVAELNNPDVQVPKIIQLIECEPTVGSKVINLANSPLYGTSRPITTIGHAIVILGFKSVAQLALTVATGGVFADDGSPCADARRTTYCQSLGVATLARQIAGQSKQANPDEAFLSGVMHDIGKIILFEAAGITYREMIAGDPTGNTTLAESEEFGTTHPELGKCCGRKWGLPNSIVVAIANHHLSLDDTCDPLSETIIAANHFARSWQIGFEPEDVDGFAEQIEGEVCKHIKGDLQAECVEQFAALREICLF